MSVRRAQQEIDSREFAEWIAYAEIEPFGYERLDVCAGVVASTIANVHRGKSGKRYTPADFMPKYGPCKQQSQKQMQNVMKMTMQRVEEFRQRKGS